MGIISCENSTKVIFTNDNPRFENEKSIMIDITKNLKYTNYLLDNEILIMGNISKIEIANVAPKRINGDIKYSETDRFNKEKDTKKLNKKPQRF